MKNQKYCFQVIVRKVIGNDPYNYHEVNYNVICDSISLVSKLLEKNSRWRSERHTVKDIFSIEKAEVNSLITKPVEQLIDSTASFNQEPILFECYYRLGNETNIALIIAFDIDSAILECFNSFSECQIVRCSRSYVIPVVG